VPLTPARRERLALLAVLLLAAALRLGWPGVNSFAYDEAQLSLLALQTARGGAAVRVGMPSSAGVPNLPAAAWVYSLPYALSPDPLVATLFTGALNVAVVAGVWALARSAWGGGAGLLAALYLAALPYGALYARSVWAQDLLPALGLFWGWSAYRAALTGSRAALAAHIFAAGFAFQVHFAGAALILPTLYCAVRWRWWRRPLALLLGGGLALLALLPFAYEAACCRPDLLAQFSGVLGGGAVFSLDGARELLRLGLGWAWGYLLLGAHQPPDSPLLAAAVGLTLLAGVVGLTRLLRSAPRGGRTLAEITAVWLLAGPLFFLRHSTPVHLHYHLAALPALALLVGAGTHALGSGWRRWLPVLPAGLAALAWSAQLAGGLALAGQIETPNGLGTPLAHTRAAAYGLPDDRPALFFTHGGDPAVDGEAAVFAALWWGRSYRVFPGESLLVLPAAPAYLMATLAPFQAWEELVDGGLAQDAGTFPRREGALPFVYTAYDGRSLPSGFALLDAPVALANGAQLEGWKARMVGPRLRISTLWRVRETPPAGVYQQFHHLRSAAALDGQPLAIADVPLAADRWRTGDRLVVMGDFWADAGGPFWVDVGHYTLPDVARIPRADGGADGLIRLGPFTAAPPE